MQKFIHSARPGIIIGKKVGIEILKVNKILKVPVHLNIDEQENLRLMLSLSPIQFPSNLRKELCLGYYYAIKNAMRLGAKE